MKINITKLCEKAEAEGCRIVRSCSRSRRYLVEPRAIAIVTPEGAVRIPIEQVCMLHKELPMVYETARRMWEELVLDEKSSIATNKGTTYGKLQKVFDELGGVINERED